MIWTVVTDGSAICDESVLRDGAGKRRYPGGWAAVIEHGSEGYVLRGREADTTNVRMELRAVIEGPRWRARDASLRLHSCPVDS
jgi:ribonuclease HI